MFWGVNGAEADGRSDFWERGPVDRLIEEIAAVWTRDTGALERNVWGSERRTVDNMEGDVEEDKLASHHAGYIPQPAKAPSRNLASILHNDRIRDHRPQPSPRGTSPIGRTSTYATEIAFRVASARCLLMRTRHFQATDASRVFKDSRFTLPSPILSSIHLPTYV